MSRGQRARRLLERWRSSFPAGPWRVTLRPPSERKQHHTVANADTVHQSYHKFQFAQYSVEEVATTICVGQPPSVNTYHWALRTWTRVPHIPVWATAPTRITRRPLAALLLATKSCPEKSPSETPGKLTRLPRSVPVRDWCRLKAKYLSATSELWRWELAVAPLSDGCGAAGGGYATAPIVRWVARPADHRRTSGITAPLSTHRSAPARRHAPQRVRWNSTCQPSYPRGHSKSRSQSPSPSGRSSRWK